jgi:hypothetical protein
MKVMRAVYELIPSFVKIQHKVCCLSNVVRTTNWLMYVAQRHQPEVAEAPGYEPTNLKP